MSKRSFEDSRDGHLPDVDHNDSLPIHDLLSPGEEQDSGATGTTKKPRNFIATVACETCRLKKTRCDESRPKCGLCKSLGLECVYNERKSSKRDQSLTMIMSTLHRLETKLENIPASILSDLEPLRGRTLPTSQNIQDLGRSPAVLENDHRVAAMSASFTLPPEEDEFDWDGNEPAADQAGQTSISFSQHGVIVWPGAQRMLPRRLLASHESLGKNYVVELESTRRPLPIFTTPYPVHAGDQWLQNVPFAMVRGLSDAFFSVFNPFTPIMDKNFFFSFTIGAALETGFGYTMESCIVLNIMALGCLALLAHQEGNYPLPGTQSHRFEAPEWMSVILEEQPGLRFFNEARRRIGFLLCDNDIQSCQFYLLSSHNVNFNEWEGDMKSRVYWNCLMNETILVQELHLPPSGLSRLEDQVPIPKFIDFSTTTYGSNRYPLSNVVDDSFFQYHFLAQVAHRIILTRIRHSLYFYSDSGTIPLPAVNAELRHQLDQWRTNLPSAIQFGDLAPSFTYSTPGEQMMHHPSPSTPASPHPSSISSPRPIDPNRPISPAVAVTDAMLRGRYMIAQFHIGRPYLYKALLIPNKLTEDDIEQIKSGLCNAMDWPITQGIFRKMKSCIPIKFAFCSQ
ncbi:transcriptional regulator family: Fungal Specific TF [Penicillium angulare]|uniref:transcriptional regulator family: Fungal Specific TF n=1 Tax=Penicillium angulare TaxID=116970 RepID=UPI002540CA5E|nr:transcriptional regulator family: Fungal Specific TF [Penicillium angulare]KAJ5256565.1 transcriptional regulator family: Fungal Specific TF [Penicillium angulare]